jgi:HAE1 family hydrophobic/amphiphilic exporter-1
VRLAYTADSKPHAWPDFFRSFARVGDAFKWGFSNFLKAPSIIAALAAAGGIYIFLKMTLLLASITAWPLILSILCYFARILLSFLEALTMTLHGFTDVSTEKTQNAYGNTLVKVLPGSFAILAVGALFLAGTVFFIAPRIPFAFMPQTDNGFMSVNIHFPRGTAVTVMNETSSRIEAALLNHPAIRTVQTVVGGNAQMTVQLLHLGKRPSVFELAPSLRKSLAPLLKDMPSARLSVGTGGGGPGGGKSVTVFVASADFDILIERNA